MKYVRGDLIQMGKDGVVDVLCQGNNIHNVQNSGFALYLRNAFPEAYQADCELLLPKGRGFLLQYWFHQLLKQFE